MSSFTDRLIVSKVKGKYWITERSFIYCIGEEGSQEFVEVPKGFKTDFASVPKILWNIIPPDGNYTQASVLHDFLYFKQMFTREKCDQIFLEAMGVLQVKKWKRNIMFWALRMFGWIGWGKHDKENAKEV